MFQLIQQLDERAAPEFSANAELLISHICSAVPVTELRAKRGADFDSTQYYQLRVKPTNPEDDRDKLLAAIAKFLSNAKSKKMGISDIVQHDRSPNSGKFASVSFKYMKLDYDVVLSLGANKGESFEKDLVVAMDNLVTGISNDPLAIAAFAALQSVDSAFKLTNVISVAPRTGSTLRSGDVSPEETGKIIGDVIIKLKRGGEKFISIKNKNGSTVAKFGIAKAFNEDLTVNDKSTEWKTWLAPFGLDPEQVGEGFQAYRDGEDTSFEPVVNIQKKVKPGSAIYKAMEKLYGVGYYYLRESAGGFTAEKIDADYIHNTLLKNLTVTQVRYPGTAKQISIYLESDGKRFLIQVRNTAGKIKPNELQLSLR